jgi:acyl carrier protein
LPPSGETASTTPSAEEVLEQLRAMMASEFGLSPRDIEPDAHLIDDLDLDSIDLVDLAVTLEDESGIKLDEDQIKSVRTVGDTVDVIHAAFTRRSAGAA